MKGGKGVVVAAFQKKPGHIKPCLTCLTLNIVPHLLCSWIWFWIMFQRHAFWR